MASTTKILTSIHGKQVGLDVNGDLIVRGRKTPTMDDTGALKRTQLTPTAVNATATLLSTDILGVIITSTTAAATVATLPTGTLFDAAAGLNINEAIDWIVINTGAANTFTVAAGATHTIVGNAVVALSTSAHFRTRKTAANTYVTYRIG